MRIMKYRMKNDLEIIWAGKEEPTKEEIVKMLRQEFELMEIEPIGMQLTTPYLPSTWYHDTPVYGLFDDDEDMPITVGEAFKQGGLA